MGKGRAPCCDKSQVKRGPWSPSEDSRLISYIQQHGHDNWRALPKLAGLSRCGKSCRLRWINYLRPDVKRGNFTRKEEETIIRLHQWSKIASHLPGRTDNEIKNVWNTYLKKRLPAFNGYADSTGDESKRDSSLTSTSSTHSSPSSFATHGAGGDRDMEIDPGNKEVQIKDMLDRTGQNKPSSSASHGSNASNISCEVGDAEKDGKEKLDLFFDIMEEVNKPDIVTGNNALLDIPFEYDTDFWTMLDSLARSPPQATEIDQLLTANAYRDSTLGDQGINRETENDKWLQYLEHELGLVEPWPPVVQGEDDSKRPKDASRPLN
ncbi:hypothetical protein CDL15_Pgr007097 [Punica granatum]|uniref:Uncharacterized protein n=1 Tax=Punica granatum TaxID=22663 RepID=A0A218X8R4_PUNGR|nr:hypothetical protein CDL15_Pgr007097 [Punica granatum]